MCGNTFDFLFMVLDMVCNVCICDCLFVLVSNCICYVNKGDFVL